MEAASPAAGTGAPLPRRIRYVHGLAEDTGLASGSVDLISFQVCVVVSRIGCCCAACMKAGEY
jgi:hypothetical protein